MAIFPVFPVQCHGNMVQGFPFPGDLSGGVGRGGDGARPSEYTVTRYTGYGDTPKVNTTSQGRGRTTASGTRNIKTRHMTLIMSSGVVWRRVDSGIGCVQKMADPKATWGGKIQVRLGSVWHN